MCFARATSRSCWRRRSGPITPTPSAWCGTGTASSRSPWKSTTCPRHSTLALSRGAKPASPPRTIEDAFGLYEIAEIQAYGDTTHALVNRSRYRGVFAPGFKPLDPDRYGPRTFRPVGLRVIDHHRRQRRGGQDGRLGRLLQQGHGLLAPGQL